VVTPVLPIRGTELMGAVTEDGADSGQSESDHQPLAGIAPGLPLMPTDEASKNSIESFATLLPQSRKAPTEIDQLKGLAIAKLSAREYPAAIDALRRVLNLNPDSPAAHGNLALALWRSKAAAQAEVHCRRAIALNPKYVPAYRIFAELLRQRDAPVAIASYRQLLALDPENFMAHNNIGLLLGKLGRRGEADAAFTRALGISPGNPEIRFNQLMMRQNESGLTEAIECCRRSLDVRPDSPDVLTNLGVVLQFAGHLEEAMARPSCCMPSKV